MPKNWYDVYMNLKTFRIIWISLLTILIVWLLWQAIVPFGRITYASDFSKENYFIEKLLPAERVQDDHVIIDEPVYIAVFTTRPFYKAIIDLRFSSPTPALQIGLARNKALWHYDFKSVKEGTMSTKLEFDLPGADRQKGQYTFMISAPKLGEQNNPLIIKDISIEFIDPSLFSVISRWFK